jgi:hypothetical protein
MPALTEILDEVYSELSRTETIDRNPINEKFPENKCKEIWKIETEIEVGKFQKEVSLLIAFEEFFPLSIPRIYLSKESFDKINHIPHIDKNHFICTFHTDSLILDTDNPVGIVTQCLRRAKQIIKDGLEGTNHNDFKDELSAYWTDNDESNLFQYLSLLSEFPKETTYLKICKLTPAYNHILYILYMADTDSNTKKFLDFISTKGCKRIENDALFLGDYKINSQPPFPENNEDILNTTSSISRISLKKYINSKNIEKHVFFLTGTSTKPILLGWKHKTIKTQRNGFRQGVLTPFMILSKFQKKDKIEKILACEYSNSRIEERTSGTVHKKYTFLIAGLGSIGSNLIYFLNGLNHPNFKLIDNDVLKIENIGRHLLGINNVNSFKTEVLKTYIKNIRPDQDVSIKTAKIESVVKTNLEYINECSYAFIALGNQNIENMLLKEQNEGNINVPMFFLWIEPYAIGGHCVFLHPDDKILLNDLYDDEQLYRFNIIASKEYRPSSNPILSKQEAGCQTSYTPYSSNDIILFLSTIYKWLNNIIQNDIKRSMVVQWTGNINFAKKLGLILNTQYIANGAYSNNIFYLHDNQER